MPQPRDQNGELFKFKRVFENVPECHRNAGVNKLWAMHLLLLAGLSIHKQGNMLMKIATDLMYFYGHSRHMTCFPQKNDVGQ